MLARCAQSALACSCLAALLCAGCLPRTTVVSNPGPRDQGIRYYRPKPYLLVQPVESAVTGSEVAIELQYLPDFSEEYSLHVRSGFGVNNTKITLDQGWNLVAIDQELDSKVAEQIEAVGKLLDGLGQVVPTAKNVPPQSTPRMVVNATNVPIGFYESVIGCGPNGRKQLMGWRYVGFAPYQACPLASAGGEALPCEAAFIYGLVYRNGVMVFEPLAKIGQRRLESISVQEAAALPSSEDRRLPAEKAAEVSMLLQQLLRVSIPPQAITVIESDARNGIQIHLTLDRATGDRFAERYAQQSRAVDEALNRLARQQRLDANATARLTWNVRDP